MKKRTILIILLSLLTCWWCLNKLLLEKKKERELVDLGKLLFITTILKNPGKDMRQIDSLYEMRRDSTLTKLNYE